MGTCQSSVTTSRPNKVKPQPTDHELLNVSRRTAPVGGLVQLSSSVGDKKSGSNPEVERETSHPIFKAIEDIQTNSGVPFGHFLDAGTGLGSLEWIAHLTSPGNKETFGVSGWNAITASKTMIRLCTEEGKRLGISTKDSLLLGNWFDEGGDGACEEDQAPEKIDFPLGDTMFDTILVDYVVGAMDAFSPFRQDSFFNRLDKHLKPGGRIYLLGMEPIPEKQSGAADLVCKAKRLRDSCILLAGERCYREHPMSWVERNMQRSGMNVLQSSKFPVLHREEDVMEQVGTARWMIKHITDPSLSCALGDACDELTREIRTHMRGGQTICLGFDYLVVAEKQQEEAN